MDLSEPAGIATPPSTDWMIPTSPLSNFGELHRELAALLVEAKKAYQERAEADMARRLEQLEETENAYEEGHRQRSTLRELRDQFAQLGTLGDGGRTRVDSILGQMDAYVEELHRLLQSEPLLQASRVREEQARTISERFDAILTHREAAGDPEALVTDLLRLARAAGYPRAAALMERFEKEAILADDEPGLRASHRFWLDVARSQFEDEQTLADEARQRARDIQSELTRRATEAQAKAEVEKLSSEIMQGVQYLDQLGPEEVIVQINIWAGKLRYYQDGFDLPSSTETRIYHTFGAINAARKRLEIDHYFEALNRTITYDWKHFVSEWEARRPQARERDQHARDTELRKQQEERQRQDQIDRRMEEARAELNTLTELLSHSDPRSDPLVREDFHDLVDSLLECDGGRIEEFLRVVAPYADLLATGPGYRSLRRSLQKRGLWPADVVPFATPEEQRTERLQVELAEPLRGPLQGKSLLIVGGVPRESVRERLTELLGLREVAWPNGWDHSLDLDGLERRIEEGNINLVVMLVRFTGHYSNHLREACSRRGAPLVKVDRGCGVTRILQAVQEQASEALSALT